MLKNKILKCSKMKSNCHDYIFKIIYFYFNLKSNKTKEVGN